MKNSIKQQTKGYYDSPIDVDQATISCFVAGPGIREYCELGVNTLHRSRDN